MQGVSSGVRQLADASGLLLAGRVAGAASSFLFAIILARTLAPADVGAALAAISTAFLASVLVTLNIESGSIRFLVAAKEAGKADVAGGFIYFGRLVLLCATPIVSGVYIAASLGSAHDADRLVMILCAAAAIPAMGWLRLSGAHATALGHPAIGSLPRTALQPLILLAVFPATLLAGAPASPGTALAAFLAAFLVAAVVQFLLLQKHVRIGSGRGRTIADWRNWLANGFYLSPIITLQEYLQHCIVLAASLALADGDVAVLAISLRFISLIRFGVLSVNMAASPRIARAMARADHTERDRQLRAAALLKAPPAAIAAAAVILLAGPILSLFGPEYMQGSRALAWFAAIPLASALLGPNHLLLNISGARGWVFAISLAAVIALFLAIPMSGATSGVERAAMSAALVYIAWELALFVVVRTKLGIDATILAIFERRR